MDTGSNKPKANDTGLLVEAVGDDLLVCDPSRDTAHVLNVTAAKVWRACDGRRDLLALQEYCQLDRETVEIALGQLHDCGLLSEPEQPTSISRREMLRKGVIAASLGAVLPAIQSVAVPASAAAAVSRNVPVATSMPPSTPAGTTVAASTTAGLTSTTSTTKPMTTTAALTTTTTTTKAVTTTAAPTTTVALTTTPAPSPPPHGSPFNPLLWILDLLRDLLRLRGH